MNNNTRISNDNAAAPAGQPLPPNRQVHLDFHTSEHIAGIGERFDRRQWQEALRAGHVNQINIFAKCHHSWSYYPTEVGHVHPHLKFDLLGEQIEACREIGVVCPIYFTVGWSANDAEAHPEWCVRNKDGAIRSSGTWDDAATQDTPKPQYHWKCLCAAATGPYHAHILQQVEEICRRYSPDGFWFDIYLDWECHCQPCRERMQREGVNEDDGDEVTRSYVLSIREHMRQLRELIARFHPNATVYFNTATHVEGSWRFKERLYELNTQQELEDLPTTWGGYDKLPIEAKYHLGLGSSVVAMSGKFHKAWGEFGGFKHADAIKYEAAAMISHGAACNFGDQLHPCGEMDIETYRSIGEAFKYVETIEDYGPGGRPYSKLGLWLTLDEKADRGMATMLLEMHADFVIASENNLDDLSVLIIPCQPCLSDAQAEEINAWVNRGGKLLVFQNGALDRQKSRFVLDIGGEYAGPAEYAFDYTVVKEAIGEGIVTTPFLNYDAGMRIRPTTGDTLAAIREPYFDRTYGHYSSHANTPYRLEDSAFPAVLRSGNVITFAHPLDRLYHDHGVRLHRDLVKNALDLLDPLPVLEVKGLPSSGRVSLLHQASQSRYVAHLLYSPVLQRGEVKVIEDFLPVPGVRITLRLPQRVTRVRAVPTDEALSFSQEGDALIVAVPTFTMHTAIVLEYEPES